VAHRSRDIVRGRISGFCRRWKKTGKADRTYLASSGIIWFISNNTAVSNPDVAAPFLPLQAIEAPGAPDKLPDQLITDANKPYITGLVSCRLTLPAGQHPSDPAAALPGLNLGRSRQGYRYTGHGTRIDQKFHNESLVRALLEQPITNVDAPLKLGPAAAANGAGKSFCGRFAQITGKYPFDPKSDQDLSVDQLNEILRPKPAPCGPSTTISSNKYW